MVDRAKTIQSIRNMRGALELRLKEKRELEELVADLTYRNEKLAFARNVAEVVCRFSDNGIQSYKRDRLEELSLETEEVLSRIFPNEDFSVRLRPDMQRNEQITKLEIGQDDVFSEMKDQNGRMCRQVTSFKINTKIQELRNAVPVLVDEALNSGDDETTQQMGIEIKGLVDRGVQVILIEHKAGLYKDLPRLQVNLVKDPILRKVTEVTVTEYGNIQRDDI